MEKEDNMIYLLTAFTFHLLEAHWGWWVLFVLFLIGDLIRGR
jgi:hypothetical protein